VNLVERGRHRGRTAIAVTAAVDAASAGRTDRDGDGADDGVVDGD